MVLIAAYYKSHPRWAEPVPGAPRTRFFDALLRTRSLARIRLVAADDRQCEPQRSTRFGPAGSIVSVSDAGGRMVIRIRAPSCEAERRVRCLAARARELDHLDPGFRFPDAKHVDRSDIDDLAAALQAHADIGNHRPLRERTGGP